ncbi:filamentous hemagglutinin N-terminal domain-containing protein [Phenylobacterium sp.]|uniref:filamentous hemagglutinin N-terminal domain-containing protein n=1 Tax=Phenylobacterium sp. TaxID=1871053 RepID=UPI0025E7CA89|nr:filamentous hemagglutinin N-terminal domain-containing protein [Phenylobacterium sp.]
MDKLTRTHPGPGTARQRFLSRTALCGALYGLQALLPSAAQAQSRPPTDPMPPATSTLTLPMGGLAEVNAGGGLPVITAATGQLDVALHAPRTVLSWTTFNVGTEASVNFTFDARSWIVLNKIVGLAPSKIEGIVTGKVGGVFGGNIWFVSQNSIVFGRGAQVDAGGILAAIGTPYVAGFLNPANTLFSFSGSDALPGSRLYVLTGGQVNGHGGLVAFAGPGIVTRANATVTADGGGSVLYGSAKTFQIRLAPGAGGDFDLVDFIVPDASGGSEDSVAADLAGDTKANSVFVAAVSKSAIGSAVINLEGMITAQGATADGGDIVLSGGGGILNRAPGPTLIDAAPTDIYLNKATALRDLQIRNVGHIYARPWFRPLDETKDPPTLDEDANPPPPVDACTDPNGCGPPPDPCSLNSCAPLGVDITGSLASLFNPSSISSITLGRDARIGATASIELGRIVANRDISVTGPDVSGNSLIAAGGLSVTATDGDVALAGVGVSKNGLVTSTLGDVKIDAISAPQKLTVSAGRDIVLGDGTSAVAGLVTLTAAQNVTLNLAAAKIDTVTAGVTADLRGGALDIGTVTAPRLLAKADSVRIGTATSSGDVYVIGLNGDAIVGSATAGDDVFVLATHGTASLGSATLTGAGADGVSVDFDGNPDVSGNGRVVRVESVDLDARLGLGTGAVTGSTAIQVKAGRDAIVDVAKDLPGGFSVIGARDATLRAPSARLDTLTAGRDLTFATTAGDLTLTAPLVATRNISISAGGALKVGDVRADAGSILLSGSTVTAGSVTASDDLTLKATAGGVVTASFKAGRDLIVQGSTLSLGSSIGPVTRDLSITSLGNFTSTTPLSAGRNLTVDVAGTAVLGQTTAVGTLRIVAGDLDLTGLATAANAAIESKTGAIRVGGAAGGAGGGLVLDSNDFGQLRVAGTVKIYAGSTTGTARGDLTLQSLTVTPANTPSIAFLVGPANNALVQGVAAPTASGGILRIGDATDLTWRPGSILVTGGLGAATYAGASYTDVRAFDEVHLAARNDILLGSARFIGLIQATAVGDIDTASGKPAGVAPIAGEASRVFVSAGRLEVSADNKVVQQNTAPLGSGATVGVFFTGKSNPALVIDPPRVLELWGALSGPDGKVLGSAAAGGAITFVVVDATGAPAPKPADARYKFNSCDVGTSNCTVAIGGGGSSAGGGGGGGSADPLVSQTNAGILAARDALGPSPPGARGSQSSSASESSAEAGQAQVSPDIVTSPPVLLAVAAADPEEIVLDPVVTGTGSEEIWRKRRQDK